MKHDNEIDITALMRTDSTETEEGMIGAMERLTDPATIQLLHAGMGLCTEGGEFLDNLKKHIFYGSELDLVNLKEEGGDSIWYLARAFQTLGTKFSTEAERVLAKLKLRYPEKFTLEHAENRDLEAERELLSRDTAGPEEPEQRPTDPSIRRRNDLQRNTEAEIAIRKALDAVEEVGADPRLTDAVVKLAEALDHVGDFVDDVPRKALPDDEVLSVLTDEGAENVVALTYRAYCEAVGGKDHDGVTLPTWQEFSSDEDRETQANGWRVCAGMAFGEGVRFAHSVSASSRPKESEPTFR